jgi:hypothetical protein
MLSIMNIIAKRLLHAAVEAIEKEEWSQTIFSPFPNLQLVHVGEYIGKKLILQLLIST